MTEQAEHWAQLWQAFRERQGMLVVLTGAGVSAASGIPTFRGADGYWTLGSARYQSQALATRAMFQSAPATVWLFYLQRIWQGLQAVPNPGHEVISDWEQALGDRFRLITQNVDGLHLLAGNSAERTYQIHGNIRSLRCSDECGAPLLPWDRQRLERLRRPLPLASANPSDSFHQRSESALPLEGSPDDWLAPDALAAAAELHCARCGAWLRPHVLWFDECYDEDNYRATSALGTARKADLLLVVGTSGATTLPQIIVQEAARRDCPIVEINTERTVFSDAAERSGGGLLVGSSATILQEIRDKLVDDATQLRSL